MNYQQIKSEILSLLQNKLPRHLSYHSVSHIEDVIKASREIGEAEGLSEENLLMLETAALFHDTGFLYGSKNHEEKSCEIAQEYLPKYGYSVAQIELIKGMIMATKIPQSPQNHMEQILADADLDYLGRDDFFIIGDKLYEELAMFGIISSERDWNLLQERFLENHHYFTKTAIERRSDKKNQNLAIIKSKLK